MSLTRQRRSRCMGYSISYIRRGIWVIQETTITFENVQNVKLTQGPLQRHFGIANVMVDTAGGSSDRKQRGGATSHQGIIEGVTQEDAARLRDLILGKLRRSATAGLGTSTTRWGWRPAHRHGCRNTSPCCATFATISRR